MRLAAQMRGGYYPAAPEAVAHTASFLRAPERGVFALLDPCAGQGTAVRQWAHLLACPHSAIHAIELEDDRAATLHTTLPEARTLAPANFFGCRASLNSFSFIWLSLPFENSYALEEAPVTQIVNDRSLWLAPAQPAWQSVATRVVRRRRVRTAGAAGLLF